MICDSFASLDKCTQNGGRRMIEIAGLIDLIEILERIAAALEEEE